MKKPLLSLLFSLPAFGATLSVDPYLSPYTGSDFIETFTEQLILNEDSWKQEPQGWNEKGAAFAYRATTLSLFWVPYANFMNTLQHEYFGHGFALRSMRRHGVYAGKYLISLPFPYGYMGGSTSYGFKDDELAPLVTNLISSRGIEGQTIMAMSLRESFFEKGVIDGRMASLYFFAQMELLRYTLAHDIHVDLGRKMDDGDDIYSYIKTIHQLKPDSDVDERKIRNIGLWYQADPIFWLSTFSFFNYLFFGNPYEVPCMQFGNVRFLPGISPNLTPFGPELIIEQLFSVNTTPFRTYFRFIPEQNQKAYGVGFKCLNLVEAFNLRFGCILDAWMAPKLNWELDPSLAAPSSPFYPGGQAMLTVRQPLQFKEDLYLGMDAGYKTEGYLAGAPIQAGVNWRASLSFNF